MAPTLRTAMDQDTSSRAYGKLRTLTQRCRWPATSEATMPQPPLPPQLAECEETTARAT